MASVRSRRPATASLLRDPIYLGSRWALYGGLFMSSLLVLRVGVVTIGDILVVLSLALAVIARLANQDVAFVRSPFASWVTVLLGLALVIGGLVSSGEAIYPTESVTVVARIVLLAMVLPWLARVVLPDGQRLAAAAAWTLAGATFAASGTLLQFVLGPNVIPNTEVTQAGRFPGWTGHVSDLGGVAAMGIALGLGFVIGARKARRASAVIAILALSVGLILSGSVSGMIAACFAMLLYVLRGSLKFSHALLIGLVLIGVTYIAAAVQSSVSGALSPVDRLLQTVGLTQQGRYSTTETRIETSDAAWASIARDPVIGVGLDPVSSIADGQFPVHNLLIGAWFQGGALLALAMLGFVLRPFFGRWLRADRSMLTTQLLAAAGAVILFSMTAPSLYNRYFWVPIALLCVARALRYGHDGGTGESKDTTDGRVEASRLGVS